MELIPTRTIDGGLAEPHPLNITYTINEPICNGASQGIHDLPPYFETDPSSGVSNYGAEVRVHASLPDHYPRNATSPSDVILFTLNGIVRSQVGEELATKRILHSSTKRKWSDFQACQKSQSTSKDPSTAKLCCNVVFPVDRPHNASSGSESSHKGPALSSTSIKTSRYISRSNALSDQHQIHGRSDVIYWIEARLIPTDYQRGELGTIISSNFLKLEFSPNKVNLKPLDTPREGTGTSQVEAQAPNLLQFKEKCQSFFSCSSRQSQLRPRLSFGISDAISRDLTLRPASSSKLSFLVPVTVTLKMPTSDSISISPTARHLPHIAFKKHLRTQGLPNTITVTNTWHTRYQYTTRPGHKDVNGELMEQSTVRRERQVLSVPPFYETQEGHFTATTLLEVSLPAVSQGTVDAGILNVKHFLDLTFKVGEGGGLGSTPVENEKQVMQAGAAIMLDRMFGMSADIHTECVLQM